MNLFDDLMSIYGISDAFSKHLFVEFLNWINKVQSFHAGCDINVAFSRKILCIWKRKKNFLFCRHQNEKKNPNYCITQQASIFKRTGIGFRCCKLKTTYFIE